MLTEVRRDLNKSQKAFRRLVWPKVRELIGGGRMESVENMPSELSKLLDIFAGFDVLVISDVMGVSGIHGLASRVQGIDRERIDKYRTFTMRYSRPKTGADTEWQKVLTHIESGQQVTKWTSQGYVTLDWGTLLSVGVVDTAPLYLHASECREETRRPRRDRCYMQRNPQDGNRFVVSPWRHLRAEGVEVKEWSDTGARIGKLLDDAYQELYQKTFADRKINPPICGRKT